MSNSNSLSQITKELLASYDLYPKKRLGQNFLVDPALLDRILQVADLSKDDTVLEIGAGLGVVTEALAKRAKDVISLEVDPDLIVICKNILKSYSNVEILRKSILEWELPSDWDSFKIIGNLPYYITAPIIEKIISEFGSKVSLAVLTIQKEVAERIIAKPGNKTYGSFSIFVQNQAEVEIDSFISKYSFYPQPKVSSAILALKPLCQSRYNINYSVVRAAFSQRRKTIQNSLSKYEINWEKIRIDPKRRAETLSLEEFSKIAA